MPGPDRPDEPASTEPTATDPPTARKPADRWHRWAIAGGLALAVGILAAGTAIAQSTTPPATTPSSSSVVASAYGHGDWGHRRLAGTVRAVDAATITVGRDDGTAVTSTVRTDGNTVYRRVARGAAAHVRVGDRVVALGERQGGAIAATSLLVKQGAGDARDEDRWDGRGRWWGGWGPWRDDATAGTVTAVQGGRVVVDDGGSSVTVRLAPSTAITVNQPATRGEVTVGTAVAVVGAGDGRAPAATVLLSADPTVVEGCRWWP